ncbi:MAG TPA: ATP-binding protein [Aliidongia sp.]|nr:ATP-binding protein [Aliidongia sp.]
MVHSSATLHLLCGKIAAGKSTLAAELAAAENTILISEDHWLGRLFPAEINTVPDYIRCSARLRAAMEPHIVGLLRLGTSIVLDFPANTIATRNWMRTLFEQAPAAHQLHFLDLPDEVCKARLHDRNQAGTHDFAASDTDFELITSHFVPPQANEGFNIVRHPAASTDAEPEFP